MEAGIYLHLRGRLVRPAIVYHADRGLKCDCPAYARDSYSVRACAAGYPIGCAAGGGVSVRLMCQRLFSWPKFILHNKYTGEHGHGLRVGPDTQQHTSHLLVQQDTPLGAQLVVG